MSIIGLGADMAAQAAEPLVGHAARRGWHEIVRFAPLTSSPHMALVITRRGRLVSVIPANARRTLSDYLDLPFDYREVDMRERMLELDLLLASRDVGYSFLAVLRLIYRVARPERVAIEHVDVLRELEEAVSQRARAIAHSLGIEEGALLKEYLIETLMAGNELPARIEHLGLKLSRVDVAVELDRNARERAATMLEQTRERPLVLHMMVESSQPHERFDVQLGGFYRMRHRDAMMLSEETAEQVIRETVQHTLRRIATNFMPSQSGEAAAAMTEELWKNAVLKATLATSNLELLRPAIQVHSARRALAASPAPESVADTLPAPEPATPVMAEAPATPPVRLRRRALAGSAVAQPAADIPPAPEIAAPVVAEMAAISPAPLPESVTDMPVDESVLAVAAPALPQGGPDEVSDPVHAGEKEEVRHTQEKGVDWDALGAGLSYSSAKGADVAKSQWEQSDHDDGEDGLAPPEWMSPIPSPAAAAPSDRPTPPRENDVPEWIEWRTAFDDRSPEPRDESLPDWLGPVRLARGEEGAPPPVEQLPAHEVVARWIELLRSQENDSFRFWARMIIARPESATELIASLTNESQLRERADDPDCLELLSQALQAALGMDGSALESPEDTPNLPATPPAPHEDARSRPVTPPAPQTEDEPDWMAFRRSFQDKNGKNE